MKSISLSSVFSWLDDHIILILASFLIAFIPLYPKLPLFDAIPGYIVRVRLEDILLLVTGVLWLIQVIRGKLQWRTPLFWMIQAYAVVGALSVLSAVFITQTVPLQPLHVGKTVLHYFRYLEYFSLLVIAFSAIRTRTHIKIMLGIITVTVLAITIYGYGQKEFYWPVYSTMNREFSKGVRLYLTEHARVQSTFGGHYDLSAYLVVTLPIILSLAFLAKQRGLSLALHIVHALGVWLLVVSASRTSFAAYLLSMVVVIGLVALFKNTWRLRLWWGTTRLTAMTLLVMVLMIYFGADMYQRFLQVLEGYPQLSTTYHQVNAERKKLFALPLAYLKGMGLPEAQVPTNGISTEDAEKMVLVPSDQRPVTTRPSDVYVNVPNIVEVATTSASGAATTVLVDLGERTYSECALKRGLSLCIRLDTLWPRAIEGFKRNPLLGSGYATLTKESVYQFTEAESTDNNFLRTLGETGLLGFVTFYGVIVVSIYYAWLLLKSDDNLARALAVGYIAASLGLLANAVYIDVFAASKVAFSYWAISGIILAYAWIIQNEPNSVLSTSVAPERGRSRTKRPRRS